MKRRAIILLFAALLSGCSTPPQDNTARLIARPDFKPAAQAAPGWVKDALHTITGLETQLAAK